MGQAWEDGTSATTERPVGQRVPSTVKPSVILAVLHDKAAGTPTTRNLKLRSKACSTGLRKWLLVTTIRFMKLFAIDEWALCSL